MNNLTEFPEDTFTTDMTGGRTKTGFELEDFYAVEDESLAERQRYLSGTTVVKRVRPFMSFREETQFMPLATRIAESFTEALSMVIDRFFPREVIDKSFLFQAVSNSLQERLRIEGYGAPEPAPILRADDEGISYERTAEPAVIKAFLRLAKSAPPEEKDRFSVYAE